MNAVVAVSSLIRKFTNVKLLVGAGILFLLSAAGFFATSLPFSISHVTALCGQPPPDVRPYSSAGDIREFLMACGAAGREAYQNLQVADLLYPAIYGVFLTAALATTLSRLAEPGSPIVALAALPLAAGGFDYLENAAAWIALIAYPAEAGLAQSLLGIASVGKQVFSWASWVLLAATIILMTIRLVQRRVRRGHVAVDSPTGGLPSDVPAALTGPGKGCLPGCDLQRPATDRHRRAGAAGRQS